MQTCKNQSLFGKGLSMEFGSEREETWYFNSLPNNKICDLTKLKGFADDNLNVTQKYFAFGMLENCVGQGEKATFSVSFVAGIVW